MPVMRAFTRHRASCGRGGQTRAVSGCRYGPQKPGCASAACSSPPAARLVLAEHHLLLFWPLPSFSPHIPFLFDINLKVEGASLTGWSPNGNSTASAWPDRYSVGIPQPELEISCWAVSARPGMRHGFVDIQPDKQGVIKCLAEDDCQRVFDTDLQANHNGYPRLDCRNRHTVNAGSVEMALLYSELKNARRTSAALSSCASSSPNTYSIPP